MYFATDIVEPGVIRHTEGNRISLGEPDGIAFGALPPDRRSFDQSPVCDVPVTARIRHEIWVKILGNVAFNPVSALTRATLVQMVRDPDASALVRNIMTEVEAVVAKLGMELPVSIDQRIAGARESGRAQNVDAAGPGSRTADGNRGDRRRGGGVGRTAGRSHAAYAQCVCLYQASGEEFSSDKELTSEPLDSIGRGVIAMMMIANLQYAWTLFVKPIIAATHWKLSDVQWGFTLFHRA